MGYQDPAVTIALIDELVKLGLTNEYLRQLHHLQASTNISVSGHRRYCGDRKRFHLGDRNAATAERLAICLQRRQAGESWDSAIAASLAKLPVAAAVVYLPTADEQELELVVSELMSLPPPSQPPPGQLVPLAVQASSGQRFQRDGHVAAYVLQRANGRCEQCDAEAPFLRADGRPFLEIHHVVRLADGGSDRVSNTTALCPNCHRLFHHSPQAGEAVQLLYKKVSELVFEIPQTFNAMSEVGDG